MLVLPWDEMDTSVLCHGAGLWKRERERWFPIKFRGSCCLKWEALFPSLSLSLSLSLSSFPFLSRKYANCVCRPGGLMGLMELLGANIVILPGMVSWFPTTAGWSVLHFRVVHVWSPCGFSLSGGDLLTLNISGLRTNDVPRPSFPFLASFLPASSLLGPFWVWCYAACARTASRHSHWVWGTDCSWFVF